MSSRVNVVIGPLCFFRNSDIPSPSDVRSYLAIEPEMIIDCESGRCARNYQIDS